MQFNPFERLTPTLIAAFQRKGKRWLISQTLPLSAEHQPPGEEKIFLLATHYADQSMATVHLKAVTGDRYAALIDLERPAHQQQIEKILRPHSPYIVFSSLIRSKAKVEKAASDLYRDKYWKFIQQNCRSGINPSKHVKPSMQLIFGEIFIILKYGSETLRTKLSDIEKM